MYSDAEIESLKEKWETLSLPLLTTQLKGAGIGNVDAVIAHMDEQFLAFMPLFYARKCAAEVYLNTANMCEYHEADYKIAQQVACFVQGAPVEKDVGMKMLGMFIAELVASYQIALGEFQKIPKNIDQILVTNGAVEEQQAWQANIG